MRLIEDYTVTFAYSQPPSFINLPLAGVPYPGMKSKFRLIYGAGHLINNIT